MSPQLSTSTHRTLMGCLPVRCTHSIQGGSAPQAFLAKEHQFRPSHLWTLPLIKSTRNRQIYPSTRPLGQARLSFSSLRCSPRHPSFTMQSFLIWKYMPCKMAFRSFLGYRSRVCGRATFTMDVFASLGSGAISTLTNAPLRETFHDASALLRHPAGFITGSSGNCPYATDAPS